MTDVAAPQFLDRTTRKRMVVWVLFVVDAIALLTATLGATWFRFATLYAGTGIQNISASVSY